MKGIASRNAILMQGIVAAKKRFCCTQDGSDAMLKIER